MSAYRFFKTDVAGLTAYPRAIDDMRAGALDGLLIRKVVPAWAIPPLLARIQRREPYLPRSSRVPGEGTPHTVPLTLLGLFDADLEGYLDDAARFSETLPSLFCDGWDPLQTLQSLLLGLTERQAISVPEDASGRGYAPFTIKTLAAGNHLTVHSGVDLLARKAMAPLRAELEPAQQLSFFFTLQPPEGGGELALYPLTHAQTDGQERVHGFPVSQLVPSLEAQRITPASGDLILFNGGQIYHSVTPVEGDVQRITMGGFVGFHADGRRLYHWS